MTHSFKACLLAVTALTSVPVMAQEAAPGTTASDSDVIIVTARKTEETLQEAPTTVSVSPPLRSTGWASTISPMSPRPCRAWCSTTRSAAMPTAR